MAALLAGIAPLVHAAVVHGVVRLDGQPVPGVIVTMNGASGAEALVTGPDGRHRLECAPADSCTLTARLEGFEPLSRDICLGPIPVELDLEMILGPVYDSVTCAGETEVPVPTRKTIRGRVTDATSQGIADAVIQIHEGSYQGCRKDRDGTLQIQELVPEKRTSVETDEDGTFVVMLGVRGPVRITASAPARQPDIRKLALADGKELMFVLLPACSPGE